MQAPVVLVHSSPLQPLWHQPGLIQVSPAIQTELQHGELSVERILGAVGGIKPGRPGVLLHYSDPFLMRARPLRGLSQWQGPRLLACGDLHHGTAPLETLAAYLEAEPHDAVLLTLSGPHSRGAQAAASAGAVVAAKLLSLSGGCASSPAPARATACWQPGASPSAAAGTGDSPTGPWPSAAAACHH